MAKNKMKNGAFEMEEEVVEGEDMGPVEDMEEGAGETETPKTMTGASIDVTPIDVPEVEGLQPGDMVTITAQCSVKKVKGDKYSLQIETFMPSEVGVTEPDVDMATEQQPGSGSGLAGLLG